MKHCLPFMAVLTGLLAAAVVPARDVPAPAVHTLGNGLKVVVIESHTLPVITLKLAVRTGAEADPAELPGTAQFVASLLNEGTRTRSAQQIAEAVDGMGGVFDSGAGWDDSWASLSTLSDQAPRAFGLLSDMVMNTAFRSAEVERARRQTLSALEALRRDPGYLAGALLERLVFAGTPYGHPADGVRESVTRLTRQDLEQFHQRYYQPANAILVVVGDIRAAEAFGLAQSSFGEWKGRALPPPRTPQRVAPSESREIVVIDDPNAVQTEIRVANLSVRRASPDYDALTVANQVLGGPAENSLFTVLRSRRGLVYDASSRIACYRSAGAWEIKTSTRTEETVKTLQLILRQMRRLDRHPITRGELENAQGYLVGHMALDFETSQQIANHILDLIIYDLPLDTWNHQAENIRSLSTQQVWSATRRYLSAKHAVVVLVGNAAGFKNNLKSLGKVRIIPMADIDFASATLEGSAHEAAANN
jgi:zinc protease